MKINKIIIWGHELHDHTHSYIHNGFYIAFKHLGYEIYWLSDKEENTKLMNFDNCLILNHGLVSKYLPISKKSIYLLHNIHLISFNNNSDEKIPGKYYKSMEYGIPKKNIVMFQPGSGKVSVQNQPYIKKI